MIENQLYHTAVLGLTFQTADVSLRDRASFMEYEISEALNSLMKIHSVCEAVILSTCNRTEIYLSLSSEPAEVETELLNWWAVQKDINVKELGEHRFYYSHMHAVNHLYRVASSLDSLVVGEAQILGQLKRAYNMAKGNYSTGTYLNSIFHRAITLGKRVRTQTKISKGAVSISSAALDLIKSRKGDLSESRVGILGTGKMGEVTLKNLLKSGVTSIHFINRSKDKADAMAREHGASSWALHEIERALGDIDILVSCTSATSYVITPQMIERVALGRDLLMVDIAAPRDIDPECSALPGVSVFDIDDLKEIVAGNLEKRKDAVTAVETIIESEKQNFFEWYRSLEVVPVLSSMRSKVESIVDDEINALTGSLSNKELEVVKKALSSVTGKFLHTPSKALKKLSHEGKAKEAIDFTCKVFDLD